MGLPAEIRRLGGTPNYGPRHNHKPKKRRGAARKKSGDLERVLLCQSVVEKVVNNHGSVVTFNDIVEASIYHL
jgi:hypothetical protein